MYNNGSEYQQTCQVAKTLNYFPYVGAANFDTARVRYQETCPNRFSEIASREECAEAIRMTQDVYDWDESEAKCLVSTNDQMLATFTDVTSGEACARTCARNMQCKGFQFDTETQLTAITDFANHNSGNNVQNVTRYVDTCFQLDNCNQNKATRLCEHECQTFHDSAAFAVAPSNLGFQCMLFDEAGKVMQGDTRILQVPDGSAVFVALSMPGSCKLYRDCHTNSNSIPAGAEVSAFQITRPAYDLGIVPTNLWQNYPPGCVLIRNGTQGWKGMFNTVRNHVTYNPNSPIAHELVSAGNRVDALASPLCNNLPPWSCEEPVYRRVCVANQAANWDIEELGKSWGTAAYGGNNTLKQSETHCYTFE